MPRGCLLLLGRAVENVGAVVGFGRSPCFLIGSDWGHGTRGLVGRWERLWDKQPLVGNLEPAAASCLPSCTLSCLGRFDPWEVGCVREGKIRVVFVFGEKLEDKTKNYVFPLVYPASES